MLRDAVKMPDMPVCPAHEGQRMGDIDDVDVFRLCPKRGEFLF
jgi:hypothetical protein